MLLLQVGSVIVTGSSKGGGVKGKAAAVDVYLPIKELEKRYALLSMVDPLMRAPASPSAVAAAAPPPGGGGALVAHRRFVELASLIVQHARAAAHTDEAAAEPLVAGRLLMLEHLARLASPLSPVVLVRVLHPHLAR